MIAQLLEILPVIVVSVVLGVWIAHILHMWLSLFNRDE
jgi:hypothetical protein